jgi:multidrug efflux pump subunit AcrB
MSKVDLLGYRAREVWVEVDPNRLLAQNVSLDEIAQAIAASNVQIPGGSVTLEHEEVLVRTAGPLQTAEDVAGVQARGQEAGWTVRVRDLAQVRDTFEVVLGMLDDDSVVVAENIYRHLEMGKPPMLAAVEGREVSLPVIASVATVASAYLPFLLVGGIWAKFLTAFPIIVILRFVASLLEAFWIMPAHVLELMRFGKPVEREGRRLYRAVSSVYRRFLAWAIRHRYRFMAFLWRSCFCLWR